MKKRILKFSIFMLPVFGQVVAQQKKQGPEVKVYTTAKGIDMRLSQSALWSFNEFKQPKETETTIFIDTTHSFQTYIGIGGAITDAAAETFAKLPADVQAELLRAYYDPKNGIGYSIARTNINSCDFSSDMYTYVDENDKDLKSFSISHDLQYKIP